MQDMFVKYIIRSNMLVVEKVSSALEMSGIMVYGHPTIWQSSYVC